MLGLRLAVSVTVVLVWLFTTGVAEAQQAAKVARIGWLGLDPDGAPHLRAAFLEGLRDLGYVEGRNLVIESRYNYGKLDRFPALAADLVALRVDVIVAPTTPSAVAAKRATRSVPVVFTSAPDPVTTGLVTSLARPGGNVTGLSFLTPELVGKHLELLKQAIPGSVASLSFGSRGSARKRTCSREQKSRRMPWDSGFNWSRHGGQAISTEPSQR